MTRRDPWSMVLGLLMAAVAALACGSDPSGGSEEPSAEVGDVAVWTRGLESEDLFDSTDFLT